MSQQRKIPIEEMIRIVELYLSGKIDIRQHIRKQAYLNRHSGSGSSDTKQTDHQDFYRRNTTKDIQKKPSSQLFWIIWQEKDRNGRSVRDTGSGIKGNLSIG